VINSHILGVKRGGLVIAPGIEADAYECLPVVTPAKAGVHEHPARKTEHGLCSRMPAFAGMTKKTREINMPPATPNLAEVSPAPHRRAPTQRRSRERQERILAVATELIAAQGSDAMRMGAVAEKAGISIGSLYQYFPDKGAIIRTLAQRYNAQGRACIEAALVDVRDIPGFRMAFGGLIDTYYAIFLAEPVMRDIWSGTQADKGLREIELADSRANGAVLAATLARLDPGADRDQLESTAFLVMQLGEATMRLAISVDRREGDALVEGYKRMVMRELAPG
jgi:AcrR family transcriptional regulator